MHELEQFQLLVTSGTRLATCLRLFWVGSRPRIQLFDKAVRFSEEVWSSSFFLVRIPSSRVWNGNQDLRLGFSDSVLAISPKSEWLIQKHQAFTTFNTEKRVTNRQIRSCALGARQPLIVEEFGTQEPVALEPFIRRCCFYKWIRCDTLNSHKHETTTMIMSELLYLSSRKVLEIAPRLEARWDLEKNCTPSKNDL